MTKKVVRKKRGNKTKRRSRTRSRRTRVKRGGMMSALRQVNIRQKIEQQLFHNVSELLRQYEYIVSTPPQASDGNIVNKGQRYGTFADIPVDPVKSSIEELKKELGNDVKNFEKIKTLYDTIMKTKKEEEQKQQDEENSKKSKRSTASQLHSSDVSLFSHVSPLSLQQPGQSINRDDALKQLMAGPTGTPNTDKHPDYSTNRTTPVKPRPKGDIREGAGHDYDDDETATRLDFSSPTRSPSHNRQGLEENELVRRLDL